MRGRDRTVTPTTSQRGSAAGRSSGPGIQAWIVYDAAALTLSMAAPSLRVTPRAATTPSEVLRVTTRPGSGRGAHAGSGGLRSTGQTGPAAALTVMGTLGDACAVSP